MRATFLIKVDVNSEQIRTMDADINYLENPQIIFLMQIGKFLNVLTEICFPDSVWGHSVVGTAHYVGSYEF